MVLALCFWDLGRKRHIVFTKFVGYAVSDQLHCKFECSSYFSNLALQLHIYIAPNIDMKKLFNYMLSSMEGEFSIKNSLFDYMQCTSLENNTQLQLNWQIQY